MRATRRRDLTAIGRFLPLIVALLGAIAAGIGATIQGLPLPFAMMAVFLFLGLLATWRARATPARGALFILVVVATVVGVVYGG
jgi:FtsH-binding integral membrane protein